MKTPRGKAIFTFSMLKGALPNQICDTFAKKRLRGDRGGTTIIIFYSFTARTPQDIPLISVSLSLLLFPLLSSLFTARHSGVLAKAPATHMSSHASLGRSSLTCLWHSDTRLDLNGFAGRRVPCPIVRGGGGSEQHVHS